MIPTNHSLLVLLRNAKGLRFNLSKLELLLNDRIEVALLCETQLTSRSYLRVPGYISYRTDLLDDSAQSILCLMGITTWGSWLANPRGRILQNFLTIHNFNLLSPNTYTYWLSANARLPKLLVFVVVSNLGNIYPSVSTLTNFCFGYSPVFLTLQLRPIARNSPLTLTPVPMDWPMFQTSLDSRMDLSPRTYARII